MNNEERQQILQNVLAGVDPEKARVAAELLKQGWPLWRVREHLDWLENKESIQRELPAASSPPITAPTESKAASLNDATVASEEIKRNADPEQVALTQ